MKVTLVLYFILSFLVLSGQESPSLLSPLETDSKRDLSLLSELDSLALKFRVDSIVNKAIKKKAFPGAQLLVAQHGKIIFHNAYGFHTYDSLQPVGLSDLYDLASITKTLGPLPALMKLVDEGKLDLDVPFSKYWKPWRKYKNKKDLTLREILAHQSGLKPYTVFLNKVLNNKKQFKRRFIRNRKSKRFSKKAYKNLYAKTRFNRKMYRMINRSEVSEEKKYLYSGLTFLLFPELIEQLTGKDYETYLRTNFYDVVGSKTLRFLPMSHHFTNKIVPTEVDTLYRHTLTKGWVHDENASLLGGVSGNAGLFGNAVDVGNMMQMFMQFGKFNGKQVLSEKVVREFIKVQYPENKNRRGLGFDKPLLNNRELALEDAYPAPEVSPQSFGHSGFTGTFTWADPVHQMVFVFLSNRVYPTRENRNLYELNIRSAVQQVFYEAMDAK